MDDVLFSKNNVSVSRTLVKVGGVSYPINGIGSVLIVAPNNKPIYFLGLFCIATGVYEYSDTILLAILIFVGFVFMLIGYLQPLTLEMRTASGNQQVLKSQDETYLVSVKEAIEEAVALRG